MALRSLISGAIRRKVSTLISRPSGRPPRRSRQHAAQHAVERPNASSAGSEVASSQSTDFSIL
jgi:hypothetical protein